jgi:chromosome segregation ATPase
MEITETTMREFFQGVVDHVATLSTQAQRVGELEQRVNELTQRINDLEGHNYQLRQEAEAANAIAAQAKAEAETHRNAAMASNEHVNALQSTIVAADHRVADLTSQLVSEQDGHKITKGDLSDARQAAQEWERQYVVTQQELDHTRDVRDGYQKQAQDAEARATELQAKLDRLSSILNPMSIQAVA